MRFKILIEPKSNYCAKDKNNVWSNGPLSIWSISKYHWFSVGFTFRACVMFVAVGCCKQVYFIKSFITHTMGNFSTHRSMH